MEAIKPQYSVLGFIGAKRVAKTLTEKQEVRVITRKKEKLLGKQEDIDDVEVIGVLKVFLAFLT